MNHSAVTSNKYPILKVESLTVYQGNYLAVRDVSFELISGTDTAIVGPNGAGKSTLVQALLGTILHAAGKVEIFDRPLERLGRLCHQIGYMPQNFIFDRSFPISVSELVGLGYVEGREARGAQLCAPTVNSMHSRAEGRKAAIDRALKRVDGYHLRRQPIGSLSGGELKRVLLGYCLVMPRQLLILDEAFAGVDAQGAADFYTLLNELKQQENWTVLQISHDLDMVNRHCDRVLCLNQSLICTGTPEIALSPQNLLATYGPNFSRYHHRH
ncbi:MAG: Zinc import ATP-binding protein ZnuC [Chroococcidiopsis sp. SAG 2025]|uniref:metal ABC transporter ATP-binding protein n=1 Tax=Chroococcidiopsis sp. SAG 2025 TaxID=171389 RepID=UPI00293747DB|nr:metal ABC transporter ATP-binding protein [Chroococcidiopsis sp. SAG 2025]MDV2990792.1 Zinc import ATP-binding protein ZnuC [Chroococcidiopsis sp. SAG 2025]